MVKLLLFLLLVWFCWPLALVVLLLFPLVWLVLLPLRIAGFAVVGALELVREIFLLPARAVRAL